MRYAVTFEQKEPPHDFGAYTIDSASYTMALVQAKTELAKFGVRFIRMTQAPKEAGAWTLYQALEFQTGPERAKLKSEDYDALLDHALQLKDQEWFTQLQQRREGSRGQ